MVERYAQLINAAQTHISNLAGAMHLLYEAQNDPQASPEVIKTLATRVQEILDQHDFTLRPIREDITKIVGPSAKK